MRKSEKLRASDPKGSVKKVKKVKKVVAEKKIKRGKSDG